MTLRRAFSLIELLVVIAVIALLVSILLPALAEARRSARAVQCMANLQQFGRAHAGYVTDYRGYLAAFNGYKEDSHLSHVWPGAFDIESQARKIVLASISDTTLSLPGIHYAGTAADSYSHLMLVPYMGEKVPMPGSACPSDAPRLSWQRDPFNMTASPYQPQKEASIYNLPWLPFGSSYQLMPAAAMKTVQPYLGSHRYYAQGMTHDSYLYTGKFQFGRRTFDEIAAPSQKVAMADTQQRHVGKRDMFYGYAAARQPLLFWDSSVSMRKTEDANKGWYPYAPGKADASVFTYDPDSGFEPPVPFSASNRREWEQSRSVTGFYRWTRGDLRGIDYGGIELNPK